MNRTRLIFRNLWFYRKPYLAVAAGIMISTAVLTGALIVGDSVRFSLQRITTLRLGNIRYALQPANRFFRQELAKEISAVAHIPVAPAIQCEGIAINNENNRRINQVQVTGIDRRFSGFWDQPMPALNEDEAIISRNVAEKLGLKPGNELLLRMQKQGKTPPDAPFAAEKEASVSIRLTITGIVDDQGMGRFSLKSNQTAPFNIFISLGQMSSRLELNGYANLLLTGGANVSRDILPILDSALRESWQPEDAGLHFGHPAGAGDEMHQITTDRIFFDDSTARTILGTVPLCSPILTYLVNSISTRTHATPYSFATAANETLLEQTIGPREILICKWLSEDLRIGPGDSLWLRYFIMGPLRALKEDSARFIVKAVIPEKNSPADRGLMPDFPGMSDAGNCRDWETGAPVDLKKIRPKDEQYWKDFRGTPKAFISLEAGQKIWKNRFGHYTAFRFRTTESQLPAMKKQLMDKLQPVRYGLSFRNVFSEGQNAAGNSTDFGQLFLSLSFFIILSAVLLTAMLFSLLARTRTAETGILSATGFRRRQILGMMSAEALLVSMAGAIPGTIAGILYNQLLVAGLNTLWNDAVNTSLIVMHLNPLTIVLGAATGIVVSVVAMVVVLWQNLRNPLADIIKGTGRDRMQDAGCRMRDAGYRMLPASCLLAALFLISWLILTGQTMNSTMFLAAGGLFLLGGLFLVNFFLARGTMKKTDDIPGFFNLVLKNASLHRSRTMAVVALLSVGTFSVIITGANRKTFYGEETARGSGTGGFLLWAETAIPVMNNLNTPGGAKAYGLQDEEVLKQVRFVQMSRLDGDDASCLNLNQVSRPVLLGVQSAVFDKLHAFGFRNILAPVDKEHPWKSLEKSTGKNIIPGFADETVITWGMRKKLGDTLFYRDEEGNVLMVKLTGSLDNSIFQGNILVSDSLLRLFFPSSGGSKVMLIDGPAGKSDTIAGRLETLFRDQGMMITTTPARLAAFNAVENTYLSVFMMLGGLGVVIGTIGLGIVILRNIRQRKQEFAIYLALGFSKKSVLRMIIAEHAFMLVAGVFVGVVSALAGILPSLISPGYAVPGLFLAGIILVILINGILWIWFPARRALTQDITAGLKEE
jgi:putative ABC transport system permease protein